MVDHSDELLARSAASLDPRVQVVASTGSRGLSGARNTGVAAATGEVVLFLDDDAAAHPGWLAGHVQHYADARRPRRRRAGRPRVGRPAPAGSPPSSAGSWAARTSASPPPPPRSATRSGRTCPSAGTRCSRRSAASRRRWAGSGPAGRAARRPRSASGSPGLPAGSDPLRAHGRGAAPRGRGARHLDLLPPALLRRGPQQGDDAPARGVPGRPRRGARLRAQDPAAGPAGHALPGPRRRRGPRPHQCRVRHGDEPAGTPPASTTNRGLP